MRRIGRDVAANGAPQSRRTLKHERSIHISLLQRCGGMFASRPSLGHVSCSAHSRLTMSRSASSPSGSSASAASAIACSAAWVSAS
jgi:hypothetical protein